MPLLTSYRREFDCLRPLAVEVDLEKYYDIYEVSHSDIQEGAGAVTVEENDGEDIDTLKALKFGLQKLHIVRKLYLCSLLALHSDGGRSDFSLWTIATESMYNLAAETKRLTCNVELILQEEEGK